MTSKPQEPVDEGASVAGELIAAARAHLSRGHPGEALLHLRLAEPSATERGEVRRLMGLAHLRLGDVEQAVDELMAAVRARPADPEVVAALDEALERLTAPRAPAQAEPVEFASDVDAAAMEAWLASPCPLADGPRDVLAAGRFNESGAASSRDPAQTTSRGDRSEAGEAIDDAETFEASAGALHQSAETFDEMVKTPDVAAETLGEVPKGSDERVEGKVTLLRSGSVATRKTAVLAAALSLAAGAAFGTLVTGRGARSADPPSRTPASDTRPVQANAPDPVPAAPAHAPAGRGQAASRGDAQRDARGSRLVPAPHAPPDGDPTEAAALPAEAAPAPAAESAPQYDFMRPLGVAAPPGGVLDPANSDARRLIREGLPGRARPAVLTFRTPLTVEQVVAFYAEAGIRLNSRVVPMGGRFQGVERTVARGSAPAAAGHEATITVSRPGVDPASKALVPETTVRIDLRGTAAP